MAAASYYNSSLPQPNKPATYSDPIPLRPMNYSYNELPPQGPSTEYQSQTAGAPQQQAYPHNPQKSRLKSKWTRWIRIISLLSKIVSTIWSTLMGAIMIYVLIKYYTTKNDSGAGRNTPWSTKSVVWPTFLLLGASAVTFIFTIFALFAMCCTKVKGGNSKIWTTVIKYAIHVLAWLTVAVLYRIFKTGDDLWGWSCSDKAQAIQSTFKTKLDFQSLCNLQTSSWYFSIFEVVAKVIFAFGQFFFHRKRENSGWKLAGDLVGIGANQVGP